MPIEHKNYPDLLLTEIDAALREKKDPLLLEAILECARGYNGLFRQPDEHQQVETTSRGMVAGLAMYDAFFDTMFRLNSEDGN